MSNSDSPHIFTPKKVVFRQKSHFWDFSLQYKAFPESEKRFFASKMSNSDSYVLPLRDVLPGSDYTKIYGQFSGGICISLCLIMCLNNNLKPNK